MDVVNEAIDPAVLDVLKSSMVDETSVTLAVPHLDRKLYAQVNDALARIGGKWNKKAQKHVFEDDPRSLFQWMLETGQMPRKNPTAYFPTPEALASRLASLIPASAQTILEPSAGTGHIARAIRATRPDALLHCCETLPQFRGKLQAQGFDVVGEDFLLYHPAHGYDAIVMNPPFSLEEDKMAYVTAWTLVNPGGQLDAIAPASVSTSKDKRVQAFQSIIEQHGSWEALEDGAFQESGTGVRTVLITLHKGVLPVSTCEHPEVAAVMPVADLDFRDKMLALTKELDQLEAESHAIHAQIDRNMQALFPGPKPRPVKKQPSVKSVETTQLALF